MIGQSEEIPLWPGAAPGSVDGDWDETESTIADGLRVVRNVARPTLLSFPADPSLATGSAVVVCPGGGFHLLSIGREGTDVAAWLNRRGVSAFVLKYRLLRTGDDFVARMMKEVADAPRLTALIASLRPLVTADAEQALRVVRQRAPANGCRADRIGILGFSAGGALAVHAALQREPSCRPDAVAAIYPYVFDDAPAPADAPPMFILCADDDPLVPPAVSLALYARWKSAARPVELHVYERGGHGFGMRTQGLPIDGWTDRLGDWLAAQSFCGR